MGKILDMDLAAKKVWRSKKSVGKMAFRIAFKIYRQTTIF
jgi:hypothetical protein